MTDKELLQAKLLSSDFQCADWAVTQDVRTRDAVVEFRLAGRVSLVRELASAALLGVPAWELTIETVFGMRRVSVRAWEGACPPMEGETFQFAWDHGCFVSSRPHSIWVDPFVESYRPPRYCEYSRVSRLADRSHDL